MSFEYFTFVFERLTDFLSYEFKLLSTDSEEVLKSLQQRVEFAQNLLKDVDQVQRQANINNELRIKVQQLMSILDEIEDLIDSLYQPHGEGDEGGWASNFSTSLKRKRSKVKWATEIAQKLQDAVNCLKGYPLSIGSPQFTRRRRLQTQPDIIKQEFIVRLEEDVKSYLSQLVSSEANLSKDLAIFGMGGAGKTTTARVVYNDKQIAEHFNKSAWVCVSQDWDKDHLLLQICQQIGVPLLDGKENLDLNQLKIVLRNSSCFFVLDDVWEVKALLELLPILRSANSSRVLVTTRNKEIFDFPQHDFSIHKIRPLTPVESRDLFIKTLDRNNSQNTKWYLEGEFVQLGEEMLEKCGGLPLAIVALAGLLSSKTTLHEWETIKSDVVRRIMRNKGAEDDYGVVSEILELSYFDLPYSLKPCFLYLGIFPEDSDIDVERLIHLWIAEGFIKVDPLLGTDTLEEVAMNYLDELVHRSMVEISEKDYGGDIATIKIHDLIRDLCIRKAKDWRLFEIPKPSTSISSSMTQSLNDSNRIIIHHRDTYFEINNPRPRSYIWFADLRQRGLCELNFPSKQMKFLRVLCLQGVDLRMPIGDLILLRYLEIDGSCRVSQESIESIKRLRNLMTFICDLQYSQIPENIAGRMEQLRHLSLPLHGVEKIGGEKLGVDNKTNLQVLRAPSGEWVTKELKDVSIGLHEMDLTRICSEAQLEAIYDFVSNQCEHLHKLSLLLMFDAKLEFDLHKLKPKHCASLELAGKIRKQEVGAFKFPCRLMKLILMSSHIDDEEQLKQGLSELGELRYLVLYDDAYMRDRLSMNGLPKLQRLSLRRLHHLKEWRIEKGGLSQLRELVIEDCKLERLPAEIRSIQSLQLIELSDMPKALIERLEPPSEDGDGEGQDFCLVRHIPQHCIG